MDLGFGFSSLLVEELHHLVGVFVYILGLGAVGKVGSEAESDQFDEEGRVAVLGSWRVLRLIHLVRETVAVVTFAKEGRNAGAHLNGESV